MKNEYEKKAWTVRKRYVKTHGLSPEVKRCKKCRNEHSGQNCKLAEAMHNAANDRAWRNDEPIQSESYSQRLRDGFNMMGDDGRMEEIYYE